MIDIIIFLKDCFFEYGLRPLLLVTVVLMSLHYISYKSPLVMRLLNKIADGIFKGMEIAGNLFPEDYRDSFLTDLIQLNERAKRKRLHPFRRIAELFLQMKGLLRHNKDYKLDKWFGDKDDKKRMGVDGYKKDEKEDNDKKDDKDEKGDKDEKDTDADG